MLTDAARQYPAIVLQVGDVSADEQQQVLPDQRTWTAAIQAITVHEERGVNRSSQSEARGSKSDEPMPQLIIMREIQTEGDVTLSIKVQTGSLLAEGDDESATGRRKAKR